MKTIILLILLSAPNDMEPEIDIMLDAVQSGQCIISDYCISLEDEEITMQDISDALEGI